MRFLWLLIFIIPISFFGTSHNEEALFLRRISEFWQEGEYQIAKSQMEEFVSKYPESPYTDSLNAALGDLLLREKNFSSAYEYYTKIKSPDLNEQALLNRMHCLYEMQWYATLADVCESFLEIQENPRVTYFLAIALYQQCINGSKEAETVIQLAERAKHYFEKLPAELSTELAESFAHICTILKDYPKASQLYLDLAKNDPSNEEEMLFQAALIQSEFDKELAIKTFDQVSLLDSKRAKEAQFNKMVLTFDKERYEELILQKETLLGMIPEEKTPVAHLLLGKSFMAQKKYPEAIFELQAYLKNGSPSPTYRQAALTLIEASFEAGDLAAMEFAISKLDPSDLELPKALFSRATMLKKKENITDAKKTIQELLMSFPQFSDRAEAYIELLSLEHKNKNWDECYELAHTFIQQFPDHRLTPFAWRYFISASAESTMISPTLRERLVTDLELFLAQNLPDSESWQFLLATTYYQLKNYEKSLEEIRENTTPNALLLSALCYRDGFQDLERFCLTAEEALEKGADIVTPKQIHMALFNAYLDLGNEEKGEEHLFQAFNTDGEIDHQNLLWLANRYYERVLQGDLSIAQKTVGLLEKATLLSSSGLRQDPKTLREGNSPALTRQELKEESLICHLAKIYTLLGRTDEAITLLEPLTSSEAQILLAESLVKKGAHEKALELLNAVASSAPTLTREIPASALLQSTRLQRQLANPNLSKIAQQLKNLIIQKTLSNEPIHLEAALDYIDLQAKNDPYKRVSLLEKTKIDFQRQDDLLSKDYHAARLQSPNKNQLFEGYMQLIDASILLAQADCEPKYQKELQAKAKNILLQIVEAPVLRDRVKVLLNDSD